MGKTDKAVIANTEKNVEEPSFKIKEERRVIENGTEENVKNVPSEGLEYLNNEITEEDRALSNEEFRNTRPKITIALAQNISLSKQSLPIPEAEKETEETIKIEDTQIVKKDNKKELQKVETILTFRGKPAKLGKKDIQALYALCIYIARWGADKQITDHIRNLSMGIYDGFKIARYININDLASIIYMTPADKVRMEDRIEVYKRLWNLSKFRQELKGKGNVLDEEEGLIPDQTIPFGDQYIGSIGGTFHMKNPKTGEINLYAEIVFSDLFFLSLIGEKAKFSPITPSIMQIRDKEERKNKNGGIMPGKILNNTEVFWKVFNMLNENRWRYVTKGVIDARKKAEEKIKEDGVRNYGLKQKIINETIEKGLAFRVPVSKILDIISDSYRNNRKRMSKTGTKGDFWVELRNTLKALVIVGYLDKDSFIEENNKEPEKSIVHFIYSRSYAKLPKFSLPSNSSTDSEEESEE